MPQSGSEIPGAHKDSTSAMPQTASAAAAPNQTLLEFSGHMSFQPDSYTPSLTPAPAFTPYPVTMPPYAPFPSYTPPYAPAPTYTPSYPVSSTYNPTTPYIPAPAGPIIEFPPNYNSTSAHANSAAPHHSVHPSAIETTTLIPVKSAALQQQSSNTYQSSAFSPMFIDVADSSVPPSPPLTSAESGEETSPLSAGQSSPLSATSSKSPESRRVLTPSESQLIKHLLSLQKGNIKAA
jgi:hypothetical protein